MNIDWGQQEVDPQYDWCTRHNRKYVDLMRNDATLTWSAYYDDKEIGDAFNSREAARVALEQYLKDNEL